VTLTASGLCNRLRIWRGRWHGVPPGDPLHERSTPEALRPNILLLCVTARSGDGASQLEAERALIEVSAPVESLLAGGTGESARSAGHGPVASPMDSVRACQAALVMIPREHERVTIGCGQRLDVDIRKPSGATGRT
jgi:hypothetical protein